MPDLNARPLDPRDTQWESWSPAYRVYFWHPFGPSGAWRSRGYEITDADVVEVITWANEHARDRETFTLFALIESNGMLGVVHLAGDDPTRPESP